jgi:hypothetical protein
MGGALAWLALKPWPSLGRVTWFPARPARWLDGEDFLCNFGGYAGLTLVAHLTLPAGRRPGVARAARVAAIALLVVGLETAQLRLPHRSFDLKDIAAGLLGVALATLPWLRRRPAQEPAAPAGAVRPLE